MTHHGHDLSGKRIAFLATDMVEQVELTEPWKAVEEAGGTVEEVSADDYDGLVLPGGVGNPDTLRMDENAVFFVRSFFEQGKPVAAICHAPWMLVEAGIVRDRTLTSFPSLRTDIRNAGGNWVDVEVHVEEGVVTSRKPDDLPAFCSKLLEELAEGTHERRTVGAATPHEAQ